MTSAAPLERLWVVGSGRMGLALGLLLHRCEAVGALAYSGRHPTPPDHPLFRGDPPLATYHAGLGVPTSPLTGVILAVPDRAVQEVAGTLVDAGLPAGAPVLHLSGALGAEALEPLARAGHPTAALHPLVSIADPVQGAERLRGAWYGVEGEGMAREVAEHIVQAASGRLLVVRPGGKPLYHAAAVFASNYVVALLATAERLMGEAGVSAATARVALTELAGGAVENYAGHGAVGALTGPVARGDVATVRLHRARLSPRERALYSLLARETLPLAREQGLESDVAEQLEQLLGEGV